MSTHIKLSGMIVFLFTLSIMMVGCKGKEESLSKESFQKSINSNTSIVDNSAVQYFSIDPTTGEVEGCPYLKLIGEVDHESLKEKRKAMRSFKDSITPTIRNLIPADEYELWYGAPNNTGEAAHDGMGPLWVDRTDDGKRIIVPIGYPHGGDMTSIYFFDGNMNLLNHYKMEQPLVVPYYRLNPEQTFYIVESAVRGTYFFFDRDGNLFRKGDFEETTGDHHTSYGGNTISETGKYWLLANNTDYLLFGDSIINKFTNSSSFQILERESLVFLTGSQADYPSFEIYKMKDDMKDSLVYKTFKTERINSLNNGFLTIASKKSKKTFYYEMVHEF